MKMAEAERLTTGTDDGQSSELQDNSKIYFSSKHRKA